MKNLDEIGIVCECGWWVELFTFKGQPWAWDVYAPDSEKNLIITTDTGDLLELSPDWTLEQMVEFLATWNQRVESFTPTITCNCGRVYSDDWMIEQASG